MTTETTLSKFAKVLSTSPTTHTDTVLVPGHDARQYEVIVRRSAGRIETECLLHTPLGNIPCRGNSHSLCYHSRVAVAMLAERAGRRVAFCKTADVAQRLAHLGGKAVEIKSRQSQAMRYGVVTEK